MSVVLSQLPKFDIHTSKEDILTKLSAFNPYPEKASQEFLVSRISHPMVNPAMWIKYLATGQVYYVHFPISYEIAEVNLPEELSESAVPDYEDDMWMDLDEFILNLSEDVVESECFSKAELDKSVKTSVVDGRFSSLSLPVFKSPEECHLSIVREALRLIKEGDPFTGWCFVDFASRTGAYSIDGKRYSDASWAVFEYTGRELAVNACPSILVQHYSHYQDRGKWDIFCDTAGEVQSLCVLSTRLMALKELQKQYAGVALSHIASVISSTEIRLRNVIQKLQNKSGLVKNTSYYDEASQYLANHQIVF